VYRSSEKLAIRTFVSVVTPLSQSHPSAKKPQPQSLYAVAHAVIARLNELGSSTLGPSVQID
jgi:hypothetical protein